MIDSQSQAPVGTKVRVMAYLELDGVRRKPGHIGTVTRHVGKETLEVRMPSGQLELFHCDGVHLVADAGSDR